MTFQTPLVKTTVLIVDDSRTILMMLADIVSSADDMRVVGTASTGQDGMRRALELEPDVVLLDLNLPDADGIQIAWALSSRLPNTSIVVVTSEDSSEVIQRAMLAGAQAYLTKPVSADVVLETIRNVRGRHLERVTRILGGRPDGVQAVPRGPDRRGRRVVIFGAKGGVGKTTIAANLSVALKTRTDKEVAAVDADFYFGDLGLHLNVISKVTIIDLLSRIADMDSELVERLMAVHVSGLKVLLGPPRPEQAELIKVEHLNRLLTALPRFYDYIVVDSQHYYDDRMLAVLDHADLILLVLTPEIGPIRNAKHFLRLGDALGYGRDKVILILNRADSNVGISLDEIQRALGVNQIVPLPSGGRAVAMSVNEGNPMVLDNPRTPWARAILDVARLVEARLESQV